MKQLGIVFLSLTLALVVASTALPGSAHSQPADAAATALKLSSAPRVDENGNAVKGQLVLTATLTTADGKPVSDQPITFSEEVSFLGGTRSALLGTATTDSTGVAAIEYQPVQQGSDAIVARFAGSSGLSAAQLRESLDVTEVVAPFPTQPVPFASLGTWLRIAFLLVVGGTWAVLLGVFLRTTTGIRAAARFAALNTTTATPSSIPAQSRQRK